MIKNHSQRINYYEMNSVVVSIFFFVAASIVAGSTSLRNDYDIYCIGNCAKDLKTNKTSPGVVLMGGGTDTDEAFLWQISKADGGDFVVLRCSGTDAYNQYIMDLSVAAGTPLNSVTTILFNDAKAAQASEVISLLQNAEALFFAGGDQNDYITQWVDTPVQSTLQEKLKTVTIGGTSAGCAILGNWVYTGSSGSVTSDTAMSNPYGREITIVPAFLKIPFLETFITDPHFVTRDRMGRLLTFMARIEADAGSKALPIFRGVGIDEHTAILLDIATGNSTVVGVSTVYVCASDHPAQVCKTRTDLTFTGIACQRLEAAAMDKYDFAAFSGSGLNYENDIVKASFTSLPYGKK